MKKKSLLLRQKADLRTALNQTLSQEAETENRISQIRQQVADYAHEHTDKVRKSSTARML